jgi:hypothetical protein
MLRTSKILASFAATLITAGGAFSQATPPILEPVIAKPPPTSRANPQPLPWERPPLEAEMLLRLNNKRRFVDPLYRKPTKEELATVAVDPAILSKWSSFLSGSKGGIVRILSALECTKGRVVISASDECAPRSMPGGGSSYSFRKKNYTVEDLADITYRDGKFVLTAKFAQAALVGPLEPSTAWKDIELSNEFRVLSNAAAPTVAGQKLNLGAIPVASEAIASVGSLLLLRTVAFRGRRILAARGVTYNELDYDRRRDVIVALRVLARDENSVTILYKIIVDKSSPKVS